MASPAPEIPIQIIEDDDEFDWEAAVREIDVACQNSTNPSSETTHLDFHNANTNFPSSSNSKNTKKFGTCRQSTLDKFIGSRTVRVEDREQDRAEGDERICCVDTDAEAAQTWIYPVNVPLRDYQFAITEKALFANTLVALPTGLGKTLIAAVVMYNYFRWFPDGKIVFAAPSRPLVMQQIEACHNIVGIPQEWTIDMTGQTSPSKRACFWKTKRVFFVTPQVLEKDIQSGTCLVKYLVCLVIDEAHRASGNYAYCVAVRELMAVPVQLRILALTATPGSKQQTIQQIIDNLYISRLEYRNESDKDVSGYVHNRELELIEVAMGQDAVEINNRLLEVIRPLVARLSAFGLIQNSYQTLSPCDLLNSRDKFRQAPPPNLPHTKYQDVEAYFGTLITLYHIRKLLSGHGIRPTYEMLEEKLQRGYFARLMSKNEDIHKARLLMQQNLSHGAPSPKLSKMLEVLVDHFKTKDSQNSRVIIFSNFRGSVRDIMDALARIGGSVRATEFIGQSSGKTLKGQSQKVQQAVLEKFRAGGYNVIVATSIGEEGLDIMEVDLVICFDANVSPLRMIQRMGRTGRKHDGRVVVLACEGSELKGYMRKQATSKAVRKHMINGGTRSFNFHSSPRMISHIYKPEVQFVELSIEQFVPRGKKLKDDQTSQTPAFKEKLTVDETDLIAKYFNPTGGNTWKPSLIAFPHFQAFPSSVHKVMHSYKTGVLIDTMQHLQGLSFHTDSETFHVEDDVSLDQCLGVDTVEQCNNGTKVSPAGTLRTKEKHSVPDCRGENPPVHSYLFGSDFVSVDILGNVQIASVPLLHFKEISHSKYTSASGAIFPNSKQNSCNLSTSTEDCKDLTAKSVEDQTNSSQPRCIRNETLPVSGLYDPDVLEEKTLEGVEKVPETPILKVKLLNEGDRPCELPDAVDVKAPSLQADEYCNDFRDIELSPRLTNLVKIGVVPESPVNCIGRSNSEGINEFLVPDLVSPGKLCNELQLKSLGPVENKNIILDNSASVRNVSVSPIDNETKTPSRMYISPSTRGCIPTSIVEECHTPLANLSNDSSSKDWLLHSGDKRGNAEQRKFKRLRKVGDNGKNCNLKRMKENSPVRVANLSKRFSTAGPIQNKHGPIQNKHDRGKKKPVDDARTFIEEEAEVSSGAEISDDEEDEQDNNSHDDSFIDDRINPTAASTQAETSRIDMMAIYRRSLLSQSPIVTQPNSSATFSPDFVAQATRISESGSSSGKALYSLQTPQTETTNHSLERNSESFQINQERILSDVMPCTTSVSHRENERNFDSQKRKLSFYQSGSVPIINLEREFSLQSEAVGKESFQQGQTEKVEEYEDDFDDDQFFEGIDLDAVEAQATLLLKQKSEELTIQKQERIPEPNPQNQCPFSCPSFDLGI